MTNTVEVPAEAPLAAAGPGGTEDRRPRSRIGRREAFRRALPWYLMVLPALALIVWLIAYPFFDSFFLSFQKVPVIGPGTWIGFDNFGRMFTDPEMWVSLRTTLIFAVGGVAIQLVLAWTLALLLFDAFPRVSSALRVAFAIPMLLSPVVVGILWRVLLDPSYGWIPAILHTQASSLLGNTATALPTMIVVDSWQWTPFMFLIIAAGLNAVPDDVLEAARIDGATSVRLFTGIIWPLTLPVTLVAILFRGLDALKAFDLPYNLTSGGPGTATQTIGIYLYRQAFTNLDKGYAATLSLLTTVLMAAVALTVLALIRRSESRIA